jgi:hypothetical protein
LETENSLAEINLKSAGRGVEGKKFANTCRFVGGRIIMQQEKLLRVKCSWTNSLNALQEVIHYSFIKFCFYYFSL